MAWLHSSKLVLLLKGQSSFQFHLFLLLLLVWLNKLDTWIDLEVNFSPGCVSAVPVQAEGQQQGSGVLCWCSPGVWLAPAFPDPALTQPSYGFQAKLRMACDPSCCTGHGVPCCTFCNCCPQPWQQLPPANRDGPAEVQCKGLNPC